MQSSIYTKRPLFGPRCENASDIIRHNRNEAFATHLPFCVKSGFILFSFCYTYLVVSTLYVANGNEFRACYCMNVCFHI